MPAVFLGIGGLMAGVYWLHERKNKILSESDSEQSGSKNE